MEHTYYNEANKRYLSRACAELGDQRAGFELKMLTGNRPEGLLQVHLREMDGTRFLDYDVTGLKPLLECDRGMAAARLYSIIFSLEKTVEMMKEFMLRPECIVLDPELIFFREESGMTFFTYAPDCPKPFKEGLGTVMEYFLKVLVPSDEKEVLLLYGLYHLTREENVTPGTLADYWRKSGNGEMTSAEEELPVLEDTRGIYEELGLNTAEEMALRGRKGKKKPEDSVKEVRTVYGGTSGSDMASSEAADNGMVDSAEAEEVLSAYESQNPHVFLALKDYFTRYRFECCVVAAVAIISVFLLLR